MKKSIATIGVIGYGLNLGTLAAQSLETKNEKVVIVYEDNEKGLEAAQKAKLQFESEGKAVELITQEDYAIVEKQRETFGNLNKKYITTRLQEELMELPVGYVEHNKIPRKKPSKTATYHPIRTEAKIQRNDACSCGSGNKYKKCCGK